MVMATTHFIQRREHRELVDSLSHVFRRSREELFLVGGAVRDSILQVPLGELDFATSARPEVTARLVEEAGFGSPYRVGEKFGTIGFPLIGGNVEITTYRSHETYAHGSRKPDVQLGGTLQEDLRRRDFTINAIAWDPDKETLIDPFGGKEDLDNRVLRAVAEPGERFEEDPLRLLRGVRFAAGLGLSIETGTFQEMTSHASSLARISRERIRDEYTLMLTALDPVSALTRLRDSGLIEHSVPQLLDLMRMPDHGPRHPLSLWDHVMRVLEATPPDLTIRWAALLHDIAKPATRVAEPSGRPRFFHHEEVGAQVAREILTGLRYPGQLVKDVALLIETHMQLHGYTSQWTDGAVRRLIIRLGPLLDSAIALARADAAGHAVGPRGLQDDDRLTELEARVSRFGHETVAAIKSPLSGDDLMARYQRPPGPWIREVKEALKDAVVDGRLAIEDRERAWTLADQLVARS
jgi:poly(A) polymerase